MKTSKIGALVATLSIAITGCRGNQTKDTAVPADTPPPADTTPPVFSGLSKVELDTSYDIDPPIAFKTDPPFVVNLAQFIGLVC